MTILLWNLTDLWSFRDPGAASVIESKHERIHVKFNTRKEIGELLGT